MFPVAKVKNVARQYLILTIAVCSVILAPVAARAGTIVCDGEVLGVMVFARGQSEGLVVVKLRLDNGSTYPWTLCNLNEDKLVNGVATSKTGHELIAAQDSYAGTCRGILSTVQIAKATEKKLRVSYLDNVFATCSDVPIWSGTVNADTDDPSGRLGAWDGLYYVELLKADVAQP
jgi:hypothetical protein